MSESPKLNSFLEDARTHGKFDSTSGFSLNTSKKQAFYQSLLEKPQEAILMLLQSGQKLGALEAHFKIGRSALTIKLTISSEGLELVKDCLSPQWFQQDLPSEHPCFELHLGLGVLSSTFGVTKMEVEKSASGGSLHLAIEFPDSGSFLSGSSKTRAEFSQVLEAQTLCSFPVTLDSRPLLATPISKSRTEKRFMEPFFFWHTPVLGKRWKAQTSEGREPIEEMESITFHLDGPKNLEPVFLARSPKSDEPSAEFYAYRAFFSSGTRCQLIPVRFGVTLAPFSVNRDSEYTRCFFSADHLEVDASNRKLRESPALQNTVRETLEHLDKYRQSMGECLHLYKPSVTAREALRNKLVGSSSLGVMVTVLSCMATPPWSPLFPLVAAFATKFGLVIGGGTFALNIRNGLELEKRAEEIKELQKRALENVADEEEPIKIFLDP